ncbi:MAG: helix-turn-helix transcriptional regulator [Actinomycetes bacterium]
MTPVEGFAKRVAGLPAALAILEMHPQGLSFADLAEELGTDGTSLRETFLAYYRADVMDLTDFRMPVVEFVGSDGEEDDPETAAVVRVAAPDPERELGVEHLSAEQLGALAAAGADMLALEPDNEVLREAMDAFSSALWPASSSGAEDQGAELAASLNAAVQQRRQVRIVYSRAWHPGTSERVVEPWRVVRTRRGWELDAGPVDADGRSRSFLVSGIRSSEALAETFERPDDVDQVIAANRAATWVELVVPQTGRWAVERFAESVEVLADDEESVSLRAAFLPPVEHRLGLMLISCGPDAFVMDPLSMADAGAAVARQLLEQHTGAAG